MTKREIKALGYDRGLRFDSDEDEDNDRQVSPFDFTAKELNDLQDTKPYDVWYVFEEGVSKGIEASLKNNGNGVV